MGSDFNNASHSVAADEPPSKPSLFSRLAGPLRSKTRNIADFHVRLHEPHRQYSAGDVVKGCVVLSVLKPFRITHLTVCLHGYVRAFKNAAAAAQVNVNPLALAIDGGRNFKYHGNGHASLFQDEQVLCGDGRLKPGRFEFGFEVLFPDKGLPSSIDFERGNISYLVAATLTRPTTISPTTTCETKVSLVEKVDIGLIAPPRERKVTMQTMRRRPRRRKTTTSSTTPSGTRLSTGTSAATITGSATNIDAPERSGSFNAGPSSEAGVSDTSAPAIPRSPKPSDLQSEVSGDSAATQNSGSFSIVGVDASGDSAAGSKSSTSEDKEITASVELLKGGCLPGDSLPVRIKIQHNRRMKSMHGIVVSLYRQGRVDYAPPAHLFSRSLSQEDIAHLERDDYYPKSRTGLGGLSLSSAGSCSVFRKDLSQSVAPLIVNPNGLTANITTSVRVPEDVFPSIRGVPGGLISFKYYVEVVVDLGGRLSGQSSGTLKQSTRAGPNGNSSASATTPFEGNNAGNWSGPMVDTDHLRREKGVIAVSLEVVVGTVDSHKTRGKAVAQPVVTMQPPSSHDLTTEQNGTAPTYDDHILGDYEEYPNFDPNQIQTPPSRGRQDLPVRPFPHAQLPDPPRTEGSIPDYIPPPDVPTNTHLSEKERVRQAEQRLLPSQPGQLPSASAAGPSAPPAPWQAEEPHAISHDSQSFDHDNREAGDGAGPSAPTVADLSQAASSSNATDDKQELERQRLMQEASSPPEMPDDFDGCPGPSAPPAGPSAPGGLSFEDAPSAPMLDEADGGYGSRDPLHRVAGPSQPAVPVHNEDLPRYER